MIHPDKPGSHQQGTVNREYYDSSTGSSEVYNAAISMASRHQDSWNAYPPTQPVPSAHENVAQRDINLDYLPPQQKVLNITRDADEDVQLTSRAYAQKLVARFFHLKVSDVQHISCNLSFFLCLVNILLLILACSLAQIVSVDKKCLTFWGYKENCDSVSYTIPVSLLKCAKSTRWLKIGAAFCILASIASFAMLWMCWVVCCWVHSQRSKTMRLNAKTGADNAVPLVDLGRIKIPMIGAAFLALLFELISWVVVVNMHQNTVCIIVLQEDQALGPGFALGVCAWVIEVFLFIILGLAV